MKFTKRAAAIMALSALAGSAAHAGLSRSSVSNVGLQIYGIYVSSDATCSTGFVATMPVRSGPQSFNFASSPTLGTGYLPSTVSCVVIVVKNRIDLSWSSGSYTSTSTGGSDNVCNSGGSTYVNPCSNKSITWPTSVLADVNAVGLTAASSCSSSPTGSEVIPVYLSTNSACTGNSTIDALLGRSGCSPNAFIPPSSSNSTSGGLIMGAGTANAAFALVSDPNGMIGNTGSSTCGALSSLPRFGGRHAASTTAAISPSSSSPTISTITVNSGIAAGATAGGETVTITGTGFGSSTRVSLAGTSCTSVSVNAAGTSLTCSTGAGSAGTGDVVVTNTDTYTSATNSSAFEYRAAPSITAVSPTALPNNASNAIITVTGTGFRNASAFGVPSTPTSYNLITIGRSTAYQVNCVNPLFSAASSSSQSITCRVTGPGATASGLTVIMTNSPDTTNTATSLGTAGASTGFNFY